MCGLIKKILIRFDITNQQNLNHSRYLKTQSTFELSFVIEKKMIELNVVEKKSIEDSVSNIIIVR